MALGGLRLFQCHKRVDGYYKNQPVEIECEKVVEFLRFRRTLERSVTAENESENRLGVFLKQNRTQATVFVISREWVRVPASTRVSLSKTPDHDCFVLRMGRKAVGPVCCTTHVNEPRNTYREKKGVCPGVFWQWLQNVPWHLVNPYNGAPW